MTDVGSADNSESLSEALSQKRILRSEEIFLDKKEVIIAGPNGSGKTTFAKQFLPLYAHCEHFVNADLIASGLSPFSPRIVGMKAGRLVLEQIRSLADKNVDFAFETTLSGKTYLAFLKDLKAKDYKIHLFFVDTNR